MYGTFIRHTEYSILLSDKRSSPNTIAARESFVVFCPLSSVCAAIFTALSCLQGSLVSYTLTTVNHSHVSMEVVVMTTQMALCASAPLVSKDTGVKSTPTSAKSSRARMGLCV